jgi:hypothetical protein
VVLVGDVVGSHTVVRQTVDRRTGKRALRASTGLDDVTDDVPAGYFRATVSVMAPRDAVHVSGCGKLEADSDLDRNERGHEKAAT